MAVLRKRGKSKWSREGEGTRSSLVRSSRASRRTEILRVLRLFDFWIFFAFSFSIFFSFCYSDWPSAGLACGQKTSKNASSRHNFYHGEATFLAGNFAVSFSLNFWSIFVHISGTIRPITLIWVLLEGSFPRASVEYRWRQFWSKLMTSEVPGYGRQRSRRVKVSYVTYASGKSSFVNLS